MGESLADVLVRAIDPMRWLGQYDLANALALFARWLRARDAASLADLEMIVNNEEARHTPQPAEATDTRDFIGASDPSRTRHCVPAEPRAVEADRCLDDCIGDCPRCRRGYRK